MEEGNERQLWSIDEVAQRWGIHPLFVRKLIRLGDLRSVTIGSRRLIPASEVKRGEQKGIGTPRKKVSQR